MQADKQVVWITGASSGIGEALAYHLSARGYRLILSARRPGALQDVKARCASPALTALLPLDLEHWETLADTAREALALFGQVVCFILAIK